VGYTLDYRYKTVLSTLLLVQRKNLKGDSYAVSQKKRKRRRVKRNNA
jgi:hypothetical protein